MRIGILGGSFDPVHLGHIKLAKLARQELKLDRIYFVPAKQSPFKTRSPTAQDRHRIQMLRLALTGCSHFLLSYYELKHAHPSYTYQTILYFKTRFPHAELFFLMGSDVFRGFKRWKNWKEIFGNCRLFVMRRKKGDVSSSKIRAKMRSKKGLNKLCAPSVIDYIENHQLYFPCH